MMKAHKTPTSGAVEILQQLIRIRTNHCDGYEKDAVKYVLSLFGDEMEFTVVEHGNNRASLVGELKGAVSDKKIALVGHLDTINNFGMELWSAPPFAADCVNGVVYGKGAANMKGGVTAIILALKSIIESGKIPPISVVMCLTAGGTRDGLGAIALSEQGYLSGVIEAIFTNPTDGKIGTAQKGAVWSKIRVDGKTSFSASPMSGTNAIEALLEFYVKLKKFVVSGKSQKHHLLGLPTCSLTQLNSGLGEVNQIPPHAEGGIDIRFLPYQDPEEIVREHYRIAESLMNGYENLHINIDILKILHSITQPDDTAIFSRFSKTLTSLGEKPCKVGLNFFGDASYIVPRMGVPFIIYGPGLHVSAINENVPLSSVEKTAAILERYIMSFNFA